MFTQAIKSSLFRRYRTTRLVVNPMMINLGLILGENVLTKALNFAVIMLLARSLGPENYGKFSFVFITMTLCSALFDFGLENTAVRFAARDKKLQEVIFGLYLQIKLGILALLTMFFLLWGEGFLHWMHKPEMAQFIPLLLIGLIGESLFFINDTWLQAIQQFKLRAILNIIRYGLLALYILILGGMGQLTLPNALAGFWIPLLFSCLFLRQYIVFYKAQSHTRLSKNLLIEMGAYEWWMLVYSVANNLIGRVDFFLLAFWVSYDQMGLYNAAFQLCAIVSFLPFVLSKVLLPALSELDNEGIFKTSTELIRVTYLAALAALLLIPIPTWIVPMVLGAQYSASIPILEVLLFAFIASLAAMTYEQALYALGEPKILTVGRYVQLFLIVGLNILGIPIFGILAAALSTLAGRLFYLIYVRQSYLHLEQSHRKGSMVLGATV